MKIINKCKDDYILKVSNHDYVARILSEGTLSNEFIEWKEVQTLDEFANHSKPISFSSDDFLIQVSPEILDELKNSHQVEFCYVSCFGWYLNKNHRVETRLFESSYPNKLNSFKEKNPAIESRSFDQFRSSYRPQKVRNMLNGAFGLSYHFYKDDYDNFFKKINWEKDSWYLNTEELTTFERQILLQLLLYQGSRKRKLIDLIVNGSDALLLYYDILHHAKEYFIYEGYSMNGFLEYLANNIDNDDVVKDITQLNERYVTKGLTYEPLMKHTGIIQEFLDLAKAEQSTLINSLDKNNNKSAIFLLGMLHLGDRLDPQFEFDNFIPSIITLTMEHIVDVYNEEKYIVIGLNETEVENDRNNKFSYVKEYFNELKHVERFKKELQDVKEDASKAKSEYQSAADQLGISYTDKPDSQKISSEDKKVSSDDPLMHLAIHQWGHPKPSRARYGRSKSNKKNPIKLLFNKFVKWLKKYFINNL